MKQPDTLKKISNNSKKLRHSEESKVKISQALYDRYGSTPENKRLARNLRGRLNKALHGNYKAGSAVNDLGCSIAELKQHLESQFKPGMSWDNYGRNGWHIDHITPLCRFNLQDEIEFKKACHFTNLQPLWAGDNLEKRKTDGTFSS
jgi:hypothetical protein